jgi:hypothetical protein
MSLTAIGLAALIRGTVVGWWRSYKQRHAGVIDARPRRGVWRPSRLIEHVDRGATWVSYFGLVCIALGVAGALYGWLK